VIQERFSNEIPLSTSESTGDSSDSKPGAAAAPSTRPKRHFSPQSSNELLFWACHLTIVAICLGIIWVKVDRMAKALTILLKAQIEELSDLG
jgi:hypothetical protein